MKRYLTHKVITAFLVSIIPQNIVFSVRIRFRFKVTLCF